MGWSWKIGDIAGIAVKVHVTFPLLIVWIAVSYWMRDGTVLAVLAGVAFILAIFGCVILHELGHALAAKRFGIRTRDITLLPIGGIARLERMPDDPKQELWVAVAGPAVNVLIAAALLVWLALTGALVPLRQLSLTEGSFLERLLMVNLFLVGFNLIPAFPMDGGRVLRALLAMKTDYTRATQAAAWIGQSIALLFAIVGLLTNVFLVLIAVFVWFGAAQEASMAQLKAALGGIPVSRAMLTNFGTISPNDSLARVVELILAGSQQDFPVMEDGRFVGVLTQQDLLTGLARRGQQARVAEVMRRAAPSADASEMLDAVLPRLEASEGRMLAVLQGEQMVGLLTLDNVGEFVAISAALRPTKIAAW